MIVFALLAILGFAASLVVHLASWGNHPFSISQTWPLHVGIFIVLIPGTLNQKGRKDHHRKYAPRWVNRVMTVCVAYALVNLAIFLIMMQLSPKDGWVKTRDGRQVIMSHGRVVRDATSEEVRRQSAITTRGFSGHWMLFYWGSLAAVVESRRRDAAEAKARQRQNLSAKPPLSDDRTRVDQSTDELRSYN